MTRASLAVKVLGLSLFALLLLVVLVEHQRQDYARRNLEKSRRIQASAERQLEIATKRARLSAGQPAPAIGDAAAGDFPMRWPMKAPENEIGSPPIQVRPPAPRPE